VFEGIWRELVSRSVRPSLVFSVSPCRKTAKTTDNTSHAYKNVCEIFEILTSEGFFFFFCKYIFLSTGCFSTKYCPIFLLRAHLMVQENRKQQLKVT
jgi:hypothetical protein